MKVNDPNLSALSSTGMSKTQAAVRADGRPAGVSGAAGPGGDDVHLSELVRILRSLASESPERQAHIEQLARTYASGGYQANPEAIAGKIVEDALAQHQ
jgi:anti-sigma28 factor (negative regulator of flagellin synthesis)